MSSVLFANTLLVFVFNDEIKAVAFATFVRIYFPVFVIILETTYHGVVPFRDLLRNQL